MTIKLKFTLYIFFGILFLWGCQNSSQNTEQQETSTPTADSASTTGEQWSVEKANSWYAGQPWLVGSDFLPSNAINQLEMWQADTWSPELIDKELGWAADLGMNTMRVYLHDIPYRTDAEGFKNRISEFLDICKKHNIKPMFVIFDSCWNPNPKAGKQPEPKPGVHNSGWVQSPGAEFLGDKTKWPQLEEYVNWLISNFKDDDRILAWDITNEPDNDNSNSYGQNNLKTELENKKEMGVELVKTAFDWARKANPSQPITSAPWYGDWSSVDKMNDMNSWLFTHSDIITFHNYSDSADFHKRVEYLKQFNRPMICTEYMARPEGSTFQTIMPVAKADKVGLINWGFVAGKSQTNYPWDSWQKPYAKEPPVWFHDIFRVDGTPYIPAETKFIKEITGAE